MRWLWLLFATGCGSVFDLVPLDELPYYGSVINDPDGDADGEPNATDLCALVPASVLGGRGDRDQDGVGDLCDPEPDRPGNCLALFDSFAAGTLSSHWRFDGESVVLDAGKVDIPYGAETIFHLDTALPAPPTATGVFGIRVLDAGVYIYTVAGYGRGC